MPTCVVPGCTSGYTSNPGKFHFFTIPKHPATAETWKIAIKRMDISVKAGRAVCQNHFRKEEILWQRQMLSPDGCVLGVRQYKIPRLRAGSVPSLFPWSELDGSSHPEPAPFKRTLSVMNQDTRCNEPNNLLQRMQQARCQKMSSNNKENENPIADVVVDGQRKNITEACATMDMSVENSDISELPLTFAKLLATEISLPSGWTVEKRLCESKNVIMLFTNTIIKINDLFTPFIVKALIVKDDMSIEISALSQPLELKEVKVPDRITNIRQLQDLLLTINSLNVCGGCTGSSVETEMSGLNCNTIKIDVTGVWRHNMCSLLLKNVTMCKYCQTAKKTLATKLRRWRASQGKKRRAPIPVTSPTQKKRWLKLQSKYRCAVRGKKQAREKMRVFKSELLECRKKMARLSNFNFDELLSSGNISVNQIHVVKQIIDAAKHKSSKGRNYSERTLRVHQTPFTHIVK